jgi:outer membrane protein OmpA-like peptidoglycan-associated protein
VDLYNYGYKTSSHNVAITAGKTATLDVTMEPVPGNVSGPWGCITIEAADRYAVLLNGKTPEYFVGHGDEFNNEFLFKQELVVPPGNHQLTIMDRNREVWSGPVNVPANERVVVDIPKGVRKTVKWTRGEKLATLSRFKAGVASATVAVAKPTAEFAATTAQVNCGAPAQLKWNSTDAPHVEISSVGPVAATGEQAVQPMQTTTYQLTASGPGGTATSTATVSVNSAIQANLTVSPAEIRYKRVGDQVVEQGNATVNWSTANTNTVAVTPIGNVANTGSQVLQPTPTKTDPGPVDETITYTLTATNACGGTETRTATAHIMGSIEPAVVTLGLRSIYFPTDLPRASKRSAGLTKSQQKALTALAEEFKKYLAAKPDAHLILDGHADRRGGQHYNQMLSERRAERAKAFLVEQGIPEANIDMRAHGYQQNLTAEQVKQLLNDHPELTAEERQQFLRKLTMLVLAYNRRVDVSLNTTGQESLRQYPFKADDFSTLVRRGTVAKKTQIAATVPTPKS